MYNLIKDAEVKIKNLTITILIGYINEHYEDEVLIIPQFINAIGFGEDLINHMRYKKWEFSPYIKSKKEEVYHYASTWDFTKEDDEYVESCLAIGECPICMSNQLEILKSGTTVCNNCESYYNITKEEELEPNFMS